MRGPGFALLCAASLLLPVPGLAQAPDAGLGIGVRADAPPFAQLRTGGDPATEGLGAFEGYAVDLCRAILRAAGDRAISPGPPAVQGVTAESRFPAPPETALAHDMLCDTTSITRARMKFCSFTVPYFVTGIVYAAAQGSYTLEELAAEPIGLVGSTTAEQRLILEWQRLFGVDPKLKAYEDYEKGAAALVSDEISALFGDQALLDEAMAGLDGYVISQRVLSVELYGFCIRPERQDLLALANQTLTGLYASGEIYELLAPHFDGKGASRLLATLYTMFGVPQE